MMHVLFHSGQKKEAEVLLVHRPPPQFDLEIQQNHNKAFSAYWWTFEEIKASQIRKASGLRELVVPFGL